jgi:ABC-type glycerol-3-phosphate transport system substrate-binding protein
VENSFEAARPDKTRREFLKMAGGLGLAAGAIAAAPRAAFGQKLRNVQMARSLSSKGTIVAAFNGTQASKTQLELAKQFESKYPGVQVKFAGYPAPDWNGFFAKVLTQLAAGEQIDAVNVATEGVQLFAHEGLAQPLDSYVMRDKAELRSFFDDVSPVLIEAMMYQGSLFLLPTDFNAGNIFYDTSLFEKAGIGRPADNWDQADFLSVVKHWANKQGAVGWDWVVRLWGSWTSWMYANDANLLAESRWPGGSWLWDEFYPGPAAPYKTGGYRWGQPTANEPATVEALQFMIDLKKQGVAPQPDLGGGGTLQGLFAANHIATTIGGGFWAGGLHSAGMKPGTFDVQYFPKWKVQKMLFGTAGYAMLKKSKNPDAAWEFLKFITSGNSLSLLVGAKAGNVSTPARRSLVTAAAYAPTGPKHWQVFYDSLDKFPNTTAIPAPSYYEAENTAFISRTTQALSSGDAKTALDGLQSDLEKLYKKS